MTDYKRLTKHKCEPLHTDMEVTDGDEIYERLAELEDMIEQGMLVQLDDNLIGQEIIGIHKWTDGTYCIDLDGNIVIGFTSKGVVTWNYSHCFNDDFENGYYFPNTEEGRLEAKAKLAELLGGNND